jgi:hypothetical protein
MLAAAALSAPLAHAGSYDVYSCTIDGGYFPNNAWVAGNNPAGNAAYGVDASCPKSGDPLAVSLAANTAYSAGTFAALWLYTPAQTAITDFKVTLRHYWYAPPLPNYPTERTYTLASFGDIFYSGTGLFRQPTRTRSGTTGTAGTATAGRTSPGRPTPAPSPSRAPRPRSRPRRRARRT